MAARVIVSARERRKFARARLPAWPGAVRHGQCEMRKKCYARYLGTGKTGHGVDEVRFPDAHPFRVTSSLEQEWNG